MNFTFSHNQKTHTNSGLDPRDAYLKHGYQGYVGPRPPNELICQSLNTTHKPIRSAAALPTHATQNLEEVASGWRSQYEVN